MTRRTRTQPPSRVRNPVARGLQQRRPTVHPDRTKYDRKRPPDIL